MQTRYYGCVGIGHRLLVLAMALQAKEISFVGIDGPNGMINGNHAFEDKKVNVIFAKDKQENIFGIQRIHRKRKKFDTANFKIKHTDLFNQFTSEIEYNEYKALGDNNA